MKPIVAIITAYEPDHEALNSLCDELDSAGLSVIVYDNSEGSAATYQATNPNVTLLQNGDNEGLGAAFNHGIDYARNRLVDIDAYLFFDQDSVVDKASVLKLIERWKKLSSASPVGVIGGNPVDSAGLSYRVALDHDLDNLNKSARFVITSFSLLPEAVARDVGEFDEDLFIDLVDNDYCFRVRKQGYICVIASDITFAHQVGLQRRSLLGIRTFSISAPLRNYYQIRNIILVGRKLRSTKFILSVLSKRVVQIVLSGLVQRDLRARVRFARKGLVDGMQGVGGRYNA